jgi:ribonuclease HI
MSQLSLDLPGQPVAVARVLMWCDGGSRGNPGPSAIGALLRDGAPDGEVLAAISEYIGHATNNVAEYRAVIAGLARAKELGAGEVVVRADSLLVINQLLGKWKVKQPHLRPLHAEARTLLGAFRSTQLLHVPREANTEADALVNAALDARIMSR